MGKELQYLKKGDKIWFVEPHHTLYEHMTTTAPKIYEAIITDDSTPQGTLPFPEYCLVHYRRPDRNNTYYNSSERGENTEGQNGHLFFTDHEECLAYVNKVAKERLERAEELLKFLKRDITELKNILGEN